MDARLIEYFCEQVRFLRVSAELYDSGVEAEAKRLAVTLRVLVHDTGSSHSILEQLGLKQRLRWLDTRHRPPPNATVLSHMGLCQAVTDGQGWSFEPFLDALPTDRADHSVSFMEWWTGEVLPDRTGHGSFDRRRFVLKAANKVGGAHVDPNIDAALAALVGGGLQGSTASFSTPTSEMGDGALATVRQIAWEALETFDVEVGHLLDPSVLAPDKPLPRLLHRETERNDRCPCGSGRKYKVCHLRAL